MAKDFPVKLDGSAKPSEHPYLSISVFLDDEMEPCYHVKVFAEFTRALLYDITVHDVLDKSSIVLRLAMELATDPTFGFGKDGRPYRWQENKWVECSKWLGGVGLALFAIIRAAGTRSGAESFEGLTETAWRTRSSYDADGLDLSAFGVCEGIPLRDGVLSPQIRKPTSTFTDDNGVATEALFEYAWQWTAHKPKNLNLRALNITIDEAMSGLSYLKSQLFDESLFSEFLYTSLTVDQATTLRRWFGYHLVVNRVPNADVMMYLHGDGGNGKSQILHLIRGLLGPESIAEVRLSDLKIQANLEQLVGAMAMLGSEATPDTELELLKSLISREPLSCNPKYRDPYTVRPRCLVTQASNQPPRFKTRDNSMVRRVRSMLLANSHVKKPIEDIAQQIIDNEFSLLVAWALTGAMEVMAAGRFKADDEVIAESNDEVRAGNHMTQFIETLEFGSFEIAELELRSVYTEWCLTNGVRPLSSQELNEELQRLLREAGARWVYMKGNRYKASFWGRNGRREPVHHLWTAGAAKRPYMYLGFRVNSDLATEPIGQALQFRREAVAIGLISDQKPGAKD